MAYCSLAQLKTYVGATDNDQRRAAVHPKRYHTDLRLYQLEYGTNGDTDGGQ